MRLALTSIKSASVAPLCAMALLYGSAALSAPLERQTAQGNSAFVSGAEFQLAEVLQPNIFFKPPAERAAEEKARADTKAKEEALAKAAAEKAAEERVNAAAAELERLTAQAQNKPEIEEEELAPPPQVAARQQAPATDAERPAAPQGRFAVASRPQSAPDAAAQNLNPQGDAASSPQQPVSQYHPLPTETQQAQAAPQAAERQTASLQDLEAQRNAARMAQALTGAQNRQQAEGQNSQQGVAQAVVDQDTPPPGYEYVPAQNQQAVMGQNGVVPATANPSQPPSAAANPWQAAPAKTITVALLTPNTDPRAGVRSLAESLTKAASLAAQEIGDRRLVLRGYDTGGTPERAVIAAEQAMADGAQLIIGPLFANNALAVANTVQPYGIPTISFTTDRTVLRRGLYSLGYLPETEIDRIIGFSSRNGVERLAVLAPETPYGNLVYAEVQNAAIRYGMDILRFQSFRPVFDAMDQTATDFATFYAENAEFDDEGELISAPIDGLMLAASGKSLQALAAYLAFRDVLPSDVKYMGLGLWDDAETFREATLRGGWFPGVDPVLKAEFEAAYTQAFSEKPSPIAGLGYDAVIVAASMIDASGPNLAQPFAVRAVERPIGFKGMSGAFRFLPDGRNERQLSVLSVGRRAFNVIEAVPGRFAAPTQASGLPR